MKLSRYAAKRTLTESKEPPAKISKGKTKVLRFVVQKHAASRLHYDFRLELDGVLKSWAIPKGPTLDPETKRLAIMVEDHPFEYRHFEGIIPNGYGAGTVMIWDEGSYSVDGEAVKKSEQLLREGLQKGHIHFTLEGKKLKGDFSLVHLKTGKENEWLFIKKKDSYSSKKPFNEDSVVSGKSLERIAGKKTDKPVKKAVKISAKKPHLIKPMLATLVDKPFSGEDWIFEMKLDGFRAIAELNNQEVEIYSRNLLSFNSKFPIVVKALKKMNLDAILDGEIVALDAKGNSSFQLLQNNSVEPTICFYVFDLLYLDGRDLRSIPLLERKKILKNLLPKNRSVIYLGHENEEGIKFFKSCQKNGLEGMIAKKKESVYKMGSRSKEWLKIKNDKRQEVIICGFTEPRRSRKHLGALIVGVYEKGELKFSGHVGSGFTEKKLQEVKQLLDPISIEKCSFKSIPQTNEVTTWVKPKYLCEVKFKEWTTDGIMRQPIFLGLRDDKPAKTVVKEKPLAVKQVAKKPSKKDAGLEHYPFLTHLDKLYWEKENITKGNVLEYYASMAKWILPYLKDKPQVLKRFPNGISKPSFYQKNLETHPEWVETATIQHQARKVEYLLIQNVESLLYAVNLGCIEIHTWFSRVGNLENPDFLVFDLDPEDISFNQVIETAQALHSFLDDLKVPNFCKTSGSRGLHILVPLGAKYTFEQSKYLAQLVAFMVHQQLPKTTSLERHPKDRQHKVYIDCLQNNYGQSLVAPYSLRAKPGAPVSTPLEWNEVKKGMTPLDFTLYSTLERIRKKKDPLAPILKKSIDLEKILKKLKAIV